MQSSFGVGRFKYIVYFAVVILIMITLSSTLVIVFSNSLAISTNTRILISTNTRILMYQTSHWDSYLVLLFIFELAQIVHSNTNVSTSM